MTTIVLGDIHGRTIWKDILNSEEYDKVIFIGDYFDTHDKISTDQQIKNFQNIVEFKNKNSSKEFILLLGNHDYHYLPGISEHYSGYNKFRAIDISEILKENLHHLQVCHKQDDIWFSHAGITNTYLKNINIEQDVKLEENINDLLNFMPEKLGFSPGPRHEGSGDEICQSIIWVRPKSLRQDSIPGKHVVGHTQHRELSCIENTFYFIDTLGTSLEYLKIKDKDIIIKQF